MKQFLKHRKKALLYLEKHPEYNALIHTIGGVGLGILITFPLIAPHPVRWAVIFLVVSLLGHAYAATAKK